jgi:antitoxin MazE
MKFETEIKQWGNSLALRISGAMAQEPAFARGSKVTVETSDSKMVITAKKINKKFTLPFSEASLLVGLNESNSHAEELASLTPEEIKV